MRLRKQLCLPKRKPDSHKGDYGCLFILAGSKGLTGAAALCCRAAMRSGAGLVTLGIPSGLNSIMAVKLTEAMTRPLPQTEQQTLSGEGFSDIKKILEDMDVIAIGPGLSLNPSTQRLVRRLIPCINKPMVIDADGLNAIAGHLNILITHNSKLKTIILTPHPGEMARLINKSIDYVQDNRLTVAKCFARDYNIILVLKGNRSVVAAPEGKIYINNTGNPGMATAGCGDVLTGMLAAFLGQGIEPFSASKLAVYLHGLAGDLAAKEKTEHGLIASDIIDKIPDAIKRVMSNE